MRPLSVTILCGAFFTFPTVSAAAGNLIMSADVAWSKTSSAIDLRLDPSGPPPWNQPFDDSDLAWGAGLGWQITDHISIQIGYTDLGEFSSSSQSLNAPNVGLEVNEYSLGAKFRFPLSGQLDATWWLGLSQADFDADGTLQIPVFILAPRPSGPIDEYFFNPFSVPDGTRVPAPTGPFTDLATLDPPVTEYDFVDPDDETGVLWGFGIDWHLSEKFSITARYLKHNIRVLDVDTFNFGVSYSL